MSSLSKLRRIVAVLWRSGLLRISPREVFAILGAWWRCRNSFAFLAAAAAIRCGSRVAIEDDDGVITFAELYQQSLALAHTLSRDFGVGAKSQVALVCSNGRGFVTGLLACTRLGADVLPLGPDLPPIVLERLLERQRISLLLHDPGGAPIVSRSLVTVAVDNLGERAVVEPPAVGRGGELIVLTSGTTGLSKGLRRRPTLGQLLPLVTGLLEAIPIRMHRPMVLAIPLHHGYGVATLAMALALGAPLQVGRRYDIAPLLDRLEATEQPFLVTVPTLLMRWLDQNPHWAGPRPAAVITGSAPLHPVLCTRLLEFLGPVLFNLYGSSEAGLIALASPQVLRRAPGSVGHPLPGNQVRLLDGAGCDVSQGKAGRIFVRGAFVLGAQVDGWRETGDLGRQDRGGHLFVCGRVDSMLVSGGENIYPHEIEAVLATHPEVAEVAVLVVEDAEFGQRMVAAVVLLEGSELRECRLREWLKERLERCKIPRRIQMVTRIPRTALGKLDRTALQRLLGAGPATD